MDAMIEFVHQWGYLAVFLGSLIEGESVILSASALASQGHLSIYKVAIIAFIGTTVADQILYIVGWRYGDAVFNRFPKLRHSSKQAFELLHKYDAGFIIACRFVYGIRIASAIVIGAAKISPYRFVPLNILSALIWTVVSCSGGYWLGSFVFELFEKVENAQKIVIWSLVGLVSAVFIGVKLYKKYRVKSV